MVVMSEKIINHCFWFFACLSAIYGCPMIVMMMVLVIMMMTMIMIINNQLQLGT